MSARVNRRRALVMADQGVSSLTNAVASIVAAWALSPDAFGAFSTAVVAYLLLQGVCRAVVGEPLLARYSAADASVRQGAAPDMLGAALLVALAGSLTFAAAGLVVDEQVRGALFAIAVVQPLIVLQDTWRYVFIVDRPGAALAVDVLWMVGMCTVLPLAPDGAGAAWFVSAWGATAGLGAVAGLVLARRTAAVPHPLRWLRTNGDMAWRFVGEFVTGASIGQVVLMGVTAIAGLSVGGAIRAAQVFYGPLNTVHQGIYLALVPEGAQTPDDSRLRSLMVKATVLIVVAAAVWGCVGVILPDSAGRWLFDDTWDKAGDLMLPMGLAMVAGSAATGGFAGVRSLGAARDSLRARLLTVGPLLALPLVGAVVAAGVGYALGFAVGNVVAAAIWWTAFSTALARRRRRRTESAGPDTVPAEIALYSTART